MDRVMSDGRALSLKEAGNYLWPHLRALPAFRAFIRSMESRLFDQLGPLPQPILDVGSGEGHFASTVWEHIDVGLDPDLESLRESRSFGIYDLLVKADGARMPFREGTFATAISNSVLEHVPALPELLADVFRVLQPGGRFIFSVPTPTLNEGLALTRAFRALGADDLAARYTGWFTKMQVHHNLLSEEVWIEHLHRTGFEVEQRIGYFSRRAARLFDLGHYAGVPSLISRRLTGEWVPLPWRPRFAPLERLLAPHIAEYDPPDATSVFFVTRKPMG